MQVNNLKYRLLDKLISIQDINLLEKVRKCKKKRSKSVSK